MGEEWSCEMDARIDDALGGVSARGRSLRFLGQLHPLHARQASRPPIPVRLVPTDINAKQGAEPIDIDRIATMVKIARDIYFTKAFAMLGLDELSPGPAASTDPQLRDRNLSSLLSAKCRCAPRSGYRKCELTNVGYHYLMTQSLVAGSKDLPH